MAEIFPILDFSQVLTDIVVMLLGRCFLLAVAGLAAYKPDFIEDKTTTLA